MVLSRIWAPIVVCVVAGCAAAALWAASPAAAVVRAWSIQPTPNPPGATSSVLSGVSCPSRTACTAVGYVTNRAGTGVTLAERWNGARWSIQSTPNPAGAISSLFFGVSCASRARCVAVGSVTRPDGTTVPLAERWNGETWSIQRTPGPARVLSYLGGVSCPSLTACVAVGHAGNRSGTAGVTLAERWDGSGWSMLPTPRPAGARVGFLSGVSCAGPASCAASGFLIDRAGAAVPLIERWDGAAWAIEPSADPAAATDVQLPGVSCPSPWSCTSVGFFSIVTGIEVMLAERWTPAGSVIQRTLYPFGARYVQLLGVSCATPRSCTAVGFDNNAPGVDVVLAERWNGRGWAIQGTPDPAGTAGASLAAVSCPSPTACVAVGSTTTRSGTVLTLVERYPRSSGVHRRHA